MQQLQGGTSQSPDQATGLFESGLSEMAYQLLTQRVPDLVPDVVTFKVLKTDVDKGFGVGAFVVSRHGQSLYVPVVMSNSAIKPLDIMYHKTLNMFLPLNKGWLDELAKAGLASLGTGVKTPETLYTDVDIRNIVVPPITGRFSYASAVLNLEQVMSPSNLIKEGDAKEPVLLLPLLRSASNRVKSAFQRMLAQYPRILKAAAAAYGMSELSSALRPSLEKTAAKQSFGGALWIADKDTTPSEFHRMFGDKAGEAYAGVRRGGYAVRDDRKSHNLTVQVQPYERWIEPNQPGVYVLYGTSGKECPALVISDPIDVLGEGSRYGRRPAIAGHNPLINEQRSGSIGRSTNKVYSMGRPDETDSLTRRRWNVSKYVAVFGDGDYIEPNRLVGRDSVADELSGPVHKRLFKDVDGQPRAGKGLFVRQKGSTFQATIPIEIKSVTTGADGVRRMRVTAVTGFSEEKTLVTDPRSGFGGIMMPKDADVVYVPPDFVWIPLRQRLDEKAWFQSAHDLARNVSSSLAAVGARTVSVKDAGAHQFSIDGRPSIGRVQALRKIAINYGIKVAAASMLLDRATRNGATRAWVVSTEQVARAQMTVNKLAADDDKGSDSSKKRKPPAAPAELPPEPDMAAGAAQAVMGPPPPPPPPSPVELAAMEMDQAIQAEMQKLQDKQHMLSMLVQRSHEIAGGAPMAASTQTQMMGAPPSSANLATGQPNPGMQGMPSSDPMGGDPGMGVGPMDPSSMGGPPSMGAGMGDPMGGQDMDPNSMGGPPGMSGMGANQGDPMGGQGMDPGGQGMGGQGMDPMGGQGQAPGALMPVDGPNGHALDTEVNPQFLQQASALPPDIFDVAAVATLVQSPELHAVVGQHLPNLEKAVDNLARVQLTLWMQESDLKERVGESVFDALEQNLSSTFKSLGDIVLRLARGVQGAKDPESYATP